MRSRLICLLTLAFLAAAACAEPVVLLDVTFTFTREDALNSTPSQSRHCLEDERLNPQRSKVWIVGASALASLWRGVMRLDSRESGLSFDPHPQM